MSELSFMGKLMQAMELSKAAHVGMELTYFDVIELLGEIESLKGYIAELEAELTSCHELQDSYCDRIAELEAALSWKPKMNGFPRMESDERW